MMRRGGVLLAACANLTACNQYQTALGGDGADSANFVGLFWVFLAVCAVMYLLLLGGFLIALARS